MNKHFLAALVFAGSLAFSTIPARADAIFTDPGTNTLRFGDGFSLGSEFVVDTANLSVTSLGLYDTTGNGFLQSHDLGLWDVTASNTEVASATIPIGTGATLVNGFRYVNLAAAVNLIIGHEYILAAFYPVGETPGVNDTLLDVNGGTNAATNPNFGSFAGAFSTTGLSISLNHLSEPNGTTAGTDYVGPNFTLRIGHPGTRHLAEYGNGIDRHRGSFPPQPLRTLIYVPNLRDEMAASRRLNRWTPYDPLQEPPSARIDSHRCRRADGDCTFQIA